MSYRNPAVIVDRKSGSAYVQGVDRFASQLANFGGEVNKLKERSQALRESNLESERQINEDIGQFQSSLGKIALTNGVNLESLISGNKSLMKDYAAAKIKIQQAVSSGNRYEGIEEDYAYVNNTKTYIDNAQSVFGSMKYMTDQYKEAMQSGGVGEKPGQVNPRFRDSRFGIMMDISNPNSGVGGQVSWERMYTAESGHQWFQVAKGEAIRKKNMELYESTGDESYKEAGDEYRMSYTELFDIQNDADGNPYNEGQFIVNPSILDKETGIGQDLVDLKIVDPKTGAIPEEMMSESSESIEASTIGNITTMQVVDTRYPDVDKITATVKASTDTYADMMLRYGPDTLAALIGAYSKRDKDGNYNYTFKEKNASGQYVDESKPTKMGDQGFFERDFSDEDNINRNGYTKEQYELIKKFVLQETLRSSGAYTPGVKKVNKSATKLYNDKLDEIKKENKPDEFSEKDKDIKFVSSKIDAFVSALRKNKGAGTLNAAISVDAMKSLENMQGIQMPGTNNTFEFKYEKPLSPGYQGQLKIIQTSGKADLYPDITIPVTDDINSIKNTLYNYFLGNITPEPGEGTVRKQDKELNAAEMLKMYGQPK